jgi:hypothetical protein
MRYHTSGYGVGDGAADPSGVSVGASVYCGTGVSVAVTSTVLYGWTEGVIGSGTISGEGVSPSIVFPPSGKLQLVRNTKNNSNRITNFVIILISSLS